LSEIFVVAGSKELHNRLDINLENPHFFTHKRVEFITRLATNKL